MYVRKTHDEYLIQQDYGSGWETVTIEETYADAREMRKCYIENTRRATRIKKVRVPNKKAN